MRTIDAYTHFFPKRYFDELPFLSPADKRLIMGEAMCKWLNWPL